MTLNTLHKIRVTLLAATARYFAIFVVRRYVYCCCFRLRFDYISFFSVSIYRRHVRAAAFCCHASPLRLASPRYAIFPFRYAAGCFRFWHKCTVTPTFILSFRQIFAAAFDIFAAAFDHSSFDFFATPLS